MTKTTSTIILVIFIVVLAFVGVFTFIPMFEYGQYGEFNSPATLIQKSALFTDSLSTVYKVELDEEVDGSQIKSAINERLNVMYGFYGSKITVDGDSLTIVIPQVSAKQEGLTAENVMDAITVRGLLECLNETTYDATKVVLSSKHLKSATTRTLVSGEQRGYVAIVTLTKEGIEAAKKLSDTSYYAIDETLTGSIQKYNDNTLYFYAGSLIGAKQIAGYVNSGELLADLTMTDSTEVTVIGGLVLAILLAVIVVACSVFFVIRYKWLGLVGVLSQVFTLVVATIFAGLVHLEIFNVSALVGLLLGLALQTYFTIYAFENISKYDNAFGAAKYKGFANSNKLNLIVHGIVLVVGIILWVIPTVVTAPLGNVLVYLAVLSFVATMGLNRLFASVIEPFVESKKSTRK